MTKLKEGLDFQVWFELRSKFSVRIIMIKIIYIIVLTLFISACSDSDIPEKVGKDHAWKEQVEVIDKAKNVQNVLNNAALEQQNNIEKQIQN